MRPLFTGLMAFVAIGVADDAMADNFSNLSSLWEVSPVDITNDQVMNLPEAQRKAFIHGAVGQLSIAFSTGKRTGGKCVRQWYFDKENGRSSLKWWMEKYPDREFGVMLFAVARRFCPTLSE